MFSKHASLPSSITRRDFLKISGCSLTSLLVFPLIQNNIQGTGLQGRVTEPHLIIYDLPSFSGKEVKVYWRDQIIPIDEVTIGDDKPAYNRIWYRIGEEGYAHSGAVQPVRTLLNQPSNKIPAEGCLAEVTVPYSDAFWGPGKKFDVAYRFYYDTTCWVSGLVQDEQGIYWYIVLEDKWDYILYMLASHLRLIPANELTLLSPDLPANAKRLEVRLSDQALIAYEWEKPVFMARVATGARFSTGNYETPRGRYMTFHKRPSRHMAAGDLASNGYDLPGVPWVSYFTEEGMSLHGTFWHNDFGKPRSHGCINLTPKAARWVYRWTVPTVPANEQKIYDKYLYGTILDIV